MAESALAHTAIIFLYITGSESEFLIFKLKCETHKSSIKWELMNVLRNKRRCYFQTECVDTKEENNKIPVKYKKCYFHTSLKKFY